MLGSSIGIFLWQTAYIWILLIVAIAFWRVWIRYVRRRFINNMDWMTLELRVPREVFKSPMAMEVVLNALHDTGGTGSWLARWWNGAVRSWHALELVSVEGSIYFFIRTQRKYQDFITAQVYSQYPNAQIREVDDYTRYVPQYRRASDWKLFGFEMILAKPDPFPLKTYIDYGMDKDLSMDEEKRLDPMTAVLELLSTMRTTEHVWIQIIIRAATKRHRDPSAPWWQLKRRSWVDAAKDEIKEFRKKSIKENLGVLKEVDGDRDWSSVTLTDIQKETLTSLERSVTKKGFDTGIRVMYMAKEDFFRPGSINGALINMFKVFGHEHMNAFKPQNATAVDFPWQDISGTKAEMMKEEMFDAYIRRAYFYPWKRRHWSHHRPGRQQFVLTTEELATIFHLPSRTAETPSFERIEATTAQPPVNLPFE